MSRAIVPRTTVTVADGVPTPIMAERMLDTEDALLFAFTNDGGFPVDVTIETTERAGGPYDAEIVPVLTVAAGTQRSLLVSPNLRARYRVTGTATGGASNVAWTLKGVARKE